MKIKLDYNFIIYFILFLFHGIIIALILLFLLNQTKKQYEYRLYSAAQSVGCIVHQKLINDAYQNIEQDIIEYDSLLQKANRIAAIHEVTYVYVLIMRNDSIFFVISSYLPEDIHNDLVTYFMDYYVEAPPIFKEVFLNKKPVTYTNIIDSWGSFYTIILYRETHTGHPYLLCADIDNTEIKNKQFTIIILILLFFGIVMILIFLFIIHREKIRIKKQIIQNEENL
ncbi:MAG: hypothetical protein N2Z72_07785 [Bacteroidales bacterium]|nr:hypothetical protein [Bacteroidales bacterium]